jgi:hypothetical protein
MPILPPNDVKLNFKYETAEDDALMYTKKWMQVQRLARKHLFKAQEKQKFNYNLGTVETKYKVGDWVMVKAPQWWENLSTVGMVHIKLQKIILK